MNTEHALLVAIRTHTDEDTPRLAYADWLEEHNQPERAEFIRVECAAARTDHDSPDYLPLLRRSDRLEKDHAAHWFGPLAGDSVVDHVITRRGFIDSVVISADRFAKHASLLFAHAPLLRGLHVAGGADWRAFFETPELTGIRNLSFEDEVFTPDAAEELAESHHVRELVELEIDRQPLGPDEMEAVSCARLDNLERLTASTCGIGDEGAAELFASKVFRNLCHLDLGENELTSAACHALAAAPDFGRIEQLVLCHNHITADGIAALASAPHLARLNALNLYLNPIGPEGGRAILASRQWGGLKGLNLIGCGVGIAVASDLRWVYGDGAVKV